MDEFEGPGKIIRARSLKRGKVEERITDRSPIAIHITVVVIRSETECMKFEMQGPSYTMYGVPGPTANSGLSAKGASSTQILIFEQLGPPIKPGPFWPIEYIIG
ncbi:unnamed protein product [Acanthoscelides obtectus]|uniref:Uncharacterized protein n=1 Tax=Acanthoscelides obtectus TaxID=200917 RepID=A0A9P0JLH3_ACAOB|nr:unnamed protein product [Acanthoscelides obtectus]CAK1662030.1 hypothetical protein AOBTE_LOCUS22940 [Acanthoscelides obtectus]